MITIFAPTMIVSLLLVVSTPPEIAMIIMLVLKMNVTPLLDVLTHPSFALMTMPVRLMTAMH
jgi:hypothetical protein